MKAYLEKLIHVVDDQHLDKLKSMKMKTSKLRKLLDCLISERDTGGKTRKELLEYLEVDDRLLRKMKSVLLRRCYEELVPGEGLPLLDLLSRYRLQENFERQLLIEEKKIRRKSNEKTKEEFYGMALTFMVRMPFSSANLDGLEKISLQILKYAKGDEKELLSLKNLAMILTVRMIREFFNRDKKATANDDFKKTIDQISLGAKVHNDRALEVFEHFIRAVHSYMVKLDYYEAEKLFSSLYKDKERLKLLPVDFANSVCGMAASSLYFTNRFEESVNIFEDNIRDKNVFFLNHPHLLMRLTEVYMITGRMDDAYEILSKHLKRFLDTGEPDAVQIAAIVYTKYYLLLGDSQSAFDYLQIVRNNLNKKFFLIHDLDTRMLEIIYFILNGDLKFAKSIIVRALKFVREKKKSKEVPKYAEGFELLHNLVIAEMKGRPLNHFVQEANNIFSGSDTIFGILISRYCNNELINQQAS